MVEHTRQQQVSEVEDSDLARVLRYHEATKHHFFRFARALGYMDWANQPDPFRRFAGAPLVPLPILGPEEEPPSPAYADLFRPGSVPSRPVSVRSLSRLFEYGLALSAWKRAGSARWALRSNPSSGNLHPTEGYVLIGEVPGFAPGAGLYHYAPKEHALERRMDCAPACYASLLEEFPPEAFVVGLTSVHWREAWKYGERAFRYCQHDAGHAVAALRFAAAALGWRMVVLGGMSDEDLALLFGLNRKEDFEGAEREHPDCAAVLWPAVADERGGDIPLALDPEILQQLVAQPWHGRANRLSQEHPVEWEIIDEVSTASWKGTRELTAVPLVDIPREVDWVPDADSYAGNPSAGQIIRQRRSALAFDGKTSISAGCFYRMLARVMPFAERPLLARPMPWDAVPWDPTIHLALFVHRVDGLVPGLYVLVREPGKLEPLRQAMQAEFLWARPPGCPAQLPLYLVLEGDARQVAAQVSCGQEIAGDSAFSLGMLAEFESSVARHGPWFYRRLFWETGVIGQILYLEAEAAGVRATGIGCFFDDPVHQLFGVRGIAWQSLYHFTTGGPVEDPRLTTEPPYATRGR